MVPDPVDEAISLFRANVLFRSFEIKGPADRLLVYLTMFINQCLKKIEKCKNKAEAVRLLAPLARDDTFAIPGTIVWFFGVTFPTGSASDRLRVYFRQSRDAVVTRLLDVVFLPDDTPNKHWMYFAKRTFMGRDLA